MKNEYINRQNRISELLEALNTATDENIIWIVNELKELEYVFKYD